MKEIPSQLKIGGHLFEIHQVDESCLNNSCGDMIRTNNIIRIDEGLVIDQKWSVLLHEVVHCMNGEMEELEVDFLAEAWFQLLSENGFLD